MSYRGGLHFVGLFGETHDDIIFNKTKYSSFMQAVFRGNLLFAPVGAPVA